MPSRPVLSSPSDKPLVYFFVGPEKTGTTTVFDLLPFARVPTQKEQFLLSRKMQLKQEIKRIEEQLALQECAFIVEPTYFISAFAREAVAKLTSHYDIKVIHTRRDPVERTVSHYLHHKSKGRVDAPDSAVVDYPEIIEASRYEAYSALWETVAPCFRVVETTNDTDFAATLEAMGIVPHQRSEVLHSNQRLAPRSAGLARIASSVWDWSIALGLNRLVPPGLKHRLKNSVYYGGAPVSATEEERACLIRLLSNTV